MLRGISALDIFKRRYFTLVIFGAVYVTYMVFHVTRIIHGPDLHRGRTSLWQAKSCNSLLTSGVLQDNIWKPDGCQMIHYETGNLRKCFQRMSETLGIAHVAFIGDSRVRTLARNLIRMVNASDPLSEHVENQKHFNYFDNEIDLHLELKWTPVVNQDMFDALKEWYKKPVRQRPTVLVAGAGLWMVNWEGVGEHNRAKFHRNTLKMKEKLDLLANDTLVLWMMYDPVIYEKLTKSRKNMTEENINWYNNMTRNFISGGEIKIWKSARMVSYAYGVSDYADGLHVSGQTLEKDLQILMNYYCNPFMSRDLGTCCSNKFHHFH